MSENGFLKSFLKGKQDDDNPVEQPVAGTQDPPADPSPSSAGAAPDEDEQNRDLQMRVIESLQQIYDPEIPVNIYELGLIYEVRVSGHGDVHVVMTLTTPHCPVAESMPGEVETRVRDVQGVGDVNVELVWDPPWDMTMMSEAARLELGLM